MAVGTSQNGGLDSTTYSDPLLVTMESAVSETTAKWCLISNLLMESLSFISDNSDCQVNSDVRVLHSIISWFWLQHFNKPLTDLCVTVDLLLYAYWYRLTLLCIIIVVHYMAIGPNSGLSNHVSLYDAIFSCKLLLTQFNTSTSSTIKCPDLAGQDTLNALTAGAAYIRVFILY